jgi:DNA (cytosine-5)-methyltransferase 1
VFTHIDLFSGIGGFALAAGWAGFRTVAFCDNEPFAQEVLRARFGAVTDADPERLEGAIPAGGECSQGCPAEHADGPVLISDIRDFDGSRFRGATLLTGGFPCQPFSVAGKRKGKSDNRFLWPEMLRVIHEARPRWVIAENVRGIVRMALGQVLSDLENIGYDFPRDLSGNPIVPVIPACALNAPHRRDRVWIIANGEGEQLDRIGTTREGWPEPPDTGWDTPWLEVATRFCRVDDGLSAWIHRRRVARLKALGNAIVPQVAYEIIKRIADIERGGEHEATQRPKK